MIRFALCALLLGVLAVCSADTAVKAVFFDDRDQHGDAVSYGVNVGSSCTSCQGFGVRLRNSWESYGLLAPSNGTTNFSLAVYDGHNCETNNDHALLTTLWGNFPGSLPNSVDSWKACPPGVQP